MTTETITVRWAGKEVSVAMWRCGACLAGTVGSNGPRLEVLSGQWPWIATADMPVSKNPFGHTAFAFRADTAQDALDGLAVRLRQIADWALETLGEKP